MKTAISIPDDLFATAEQLAQRFGMSRSELYVTALRDFVAAHKFDGVTERLNAIYDQEPSTLDPALMELQMRSLPREDW
jgi:metal-responsive CopG/Arc/MetJ family transcriptional regulator